MRRIETLKEGTEAVGNRVRVKVVKNKVAAPFRQAEFDVEYGVGISHEGCLLDLGLEHDLVQKSGSFFSYGELRLGQGRNNTKQYLAENPELAGEIEAKLFAELGIERAPRPSRAVAEDGADEAPPAVAEVPSADAEPERKAA
jgi:recombination protein RecA